MAGRGTAYRQISHRLGCRPSPVRRATKGVVPTEKIIAEWEAEWEADPPLWLVKARKKKSRADRSQQLRQQQRRKAEARRARRRAKINAGTCPDCGFGLSAWRSWESDEDHEADCRFYLSDYCTCPEPERITVPYCERCQKVITAARSYHLIEGDCPVDVADPERGLVSRVDDQHDHSTPVHPTADEA